MKVKKYFGFGLNSAIPSSVKFALKKLHKSTTHFNLCECFNTVIHALSLFELYKKTT
jgi:hypothetical protein